MGWYCETCKEETEWDYVPPSRTELKGGEVYDAQSVKRRNFWMSLRRSAVSKFGLQLPQNLISYLYPSARLL